MDSLGVATRHIALIKCSATVDVLRHRVLGAVRSGDRETAGVGFQSLAAPRLSRPCWTLYTEPVCGEPGARLAILYALARRPTTPNFLASQLASVSDPPAPKVWPQRGQHSSRPWLDLPSCAPSSLCSLDGLVSLQAAIGQGISEKRSCEYGVPETRRGRVQRSENKNPEMVWCLESETEDRPTSIRECVRSSTLAKQYTSELQHCRLGAYALVAGRLLIGVAMTNAETPCANIPGRHFSRLVEQTGILKMAG